jgi:pantoate--beta-alanine ligase
MYPKGFSTTVDVGTITTPLEGHARGAVHFRGVATVVSKLLNIVRPTHAYFGQKDAQQVLVIKRLVRDLNVPVEIVTCPTVREADGLAMSSRNARLSPDVRAQALGLSAALATVQLLTTNGERRAALLQAAGTRILAAHGIDDAAVDYLAIVNAETLEPLDTVTDGALVAVAAHVAASG